jgi:hypothetical protein
MQIERWFMGKENTGRRSIFGCFCGMLHGGLVDIE